MTKPTLDQIRKQAKEFQKSHPEASAAVFGAKYPGQYPEAVRAIREVRGRP